MDSIHLAQAAELGSFWLVGWLMDSRERLYSMELVKELVR